jgi:propanol-preferring alcohol dehydrogenase
MKAMLFKSPGQPLSYEEVPLEEPGPGQIRIKVLACAICRTDLHIIDGDIKPAQTPLILGHQIVGVVDKIGPNVSSFSPASPVCIGWLGHTCQTCSYCQADHENLCDGAKFNGFHLPGGFAQYLIAEAAYAFSYDLQDRPAANLAPLMCAGLIGYRSLKQACGSHIGFFGFGSAAYILTQMATQLGKSIYAFTKPGDPIKAKIALELGAVWAGGSDEKPPQLLDSAIIFAASGELVPQALACIKKGGRVVCAGISMSPIPSFSYDLLYQERSLCSIANLTRADAQEFLKLIQTIPVKTHVTCYPLKEANQAIADLKEGKIIGSAVLIPP